MTKDLQHIETLLAKYFDGDTTAAEERLLADYFSRAGDEMPDEWRPCRAIFAYVDDERQVSVTPSQTAEARPPAVQAALKPRLSVAAAVFAAACIVAAVVLLPETGGRGDYAVIDGRVCTNRAVVEQEALDALGMVSTDEADLSSALDIMVE